MSREERKMAQIIASIERMEQRKASTPSTTAAATSSRTDASADSDSNASSSSSTGSGAKATAAATSAAADHPHALERLNSSEIHAQVQKSSGRLGAKGRKLKPLGAAQSGGSKAKVKAVNKRAKTPQMLAVDNKVMVSSKLTPKKRWIQLWTEQLSSPSDESPDADADTNSNSKDDDDVMDSSSKSDSLEAAVETSEQEPEPEQEQEPPQSSTQAADPVSSTADPTPAPVQAPANAPVAAPATSPEQTARARPTIVSKDPVDEESEAEEGEERQSAAPDASLASPSPQTDESKDTSISPVSSVKEPLKDAPAALTPSKTNEERSGNFVTPTDASAAAPAGDTPATLPSTTAVKSIRSAASVTNVVLEDGGADDASKTRQPLTTELIARGSPSTTSGISHERPRKRSLERKNSEPLTEDEKRRAERRRQRKSNWDVGDPRFASRTGDKPSGRSPLSDDIALASKFPPGRPSWRHSNSMDATHSSGKPGFPNRSSFSGGGPPRRGFYSSNSLPLDRSRSAGRSTSGYHYANSYR